MMYPPGDKETIDFTPLDMVILSIEVEVEEEENGCQERQMDRPNGGFRRGYSQGNSVGTQQAPTDRPQLDRQEEDWSIPANVERREDTERHEISQVPPPDVLPSHRRKIIYQLE